MPDSQKLFLWEERLIVAFILGWLSGEEKSTISKGIKRNKLNFWQLHVVGMKD